MDRHQFVEKHVEKRDRLKENLEKLNKKKDVAYSRSRDYFRSFLNNEEDTNTTLHHNLPSSDMALMTNTAIGHLAIGHLAMGTSHKDAEKATDEDIVKLCGEIDSLEKAIIAVNTDIHELEQRDFIKEIIKHVK